MNHDELVDGTSRDRVPEATGGPVVDVRGHVHELRKALLPALVIALVVGLLVGVLRYLQPPVYTSEGTSRIGLSSVGVSDTYAKAAAYQFESLATDDELLTAVAQQNGFGSAQDVADAVTVKASLAPGIVTVQARADSNEAADELVRSTITQLDKLSVERNGSSVDSAAALDATARLGEIDGKIAAASDRDSSTLSALYKERQSIVGQMQSTSGAAPLRIQLLAINHEGGTQSSPTPYRDGVIAALIAFLVALELVVLLRRRRKTVESTWTGRVATKYGIECDRSIDGAPGIPSSTRIHVKRLRDEGAEVLVLSDAATDAEDLGTGAVHGLRDRWWEEGDLAAIGLAVLVASEGRTPKHDVLACLDDLSVAGVPTRMVLRPGGEVEGAAGSVGS